MSLTKPELPLRGDIVQVNEGGRRVYRTPDGVFPSVTNILKVLGLSTEALVSWSANQERLALFEAVEQIEKGGAVPTVVSIEGVLGTARRHVVALNRAADIGTQLHDAVAWYLAGALGEDRGDQPRLGPEANAAFTNWLKWWSEARLEPISSEQPLWSAEFGYAGTCDLIALDKDQRVGVVDFKSGAGIYLEHHLQVSAYVKAAQRWVPAEWGMVVRLPKSAKQDFKAERDVEMLGQWRYGKRRYTFAELFDVFSAARTCHHIINTGGLS